MASTLLEILNNKNMDITLDQLENKIRNQSIILKEQHLYIDKLKLIINIQNIAQSKQPYEFDELKITIRTQTKQKDHIENMMKILAHENKELKQEIIGLKQENKELKQEIIGLKQENKEIKFELTEMKNRNIIQSIIISIQDINAFYELEKKLNNKKHLVRLRNNRLDMCHFLYNEDDNNTINSKNYYFLEYLKNMNVNLKNMLYKKCDKDLLDEIIEFLELNTKNDNLDNSLKYDEWFL